MTRWGGTVGDDEKWGVGTALNLRTTTSRKYAAVPRRARIQGSQTFVSLKSRLQGDHEEEGCAWRRVRTVSGAGDCRGGQGGSRARGCNGADRLCYGAPPPP